MKTLTQNYPKLMFNKFHQMGKDSFEFWKDFENDFGKTNFFTFGSHAT
jgi:hypothetical protein